MEFIEYKGWKNNVRLTNDKIELVVTLDVGPRIIRFGYIGSKNVLKEFSDQIGQRGEKEWMIRGGHRFWHAPEEKPRTYEPDNQPVECIEIGDQSVLLRPKAETKNGIQKELEIALNPDGTVKLLHRLKNIGRWPIEAAPWALTVMDMGGVAVLPLPEKRPHNEVLLPDFPLVVWPYTDFSDKRLSLGRRFITLKQDKFLGPIKIGMAKQDTIAYLVHDQVFIKKFNYHEGASYPDFGCNCELFTNNDMLELESLGSLQTIEPGSFIEHAENWLIKKQKADYKTESDLYSIFK